MIPLEQQVTSLELSKRLKELGEKQDSVWYWIRTGSNTYEILTKEEAMRTMEMPFRDMQLYSAFTVAEHGIALPRNIKSYRDTDFKTEFWVCEQSFKNVEYADTEADARAKMLIYLIENKLVEVEKEK